MGSQNSMNSIFIGTDAGYTNADWSLDNSAVGDTSILIGSYTSTGGHSNSIAIGKGATNDATNQFAWSDDITKWKFQGDSYTLPTAFPSTNKVLQSTSSGVMTWETAAIAAGSNYQLQYYNNGALDANSGMFFTPSTATLSLYDVSNGNGTITTGNLNLTTNAGSKNVLIKPSASLTSDYTLTLPINSGSSNQVLATDGSGILSWATSSTSPISVGSSGNTLYTPGLGAGEGENFDGTVGYNIFLGENAGNSASNAQFSNFLGNFAGFNAANVFNANFLGLSAGSGAISASDSNFFGASAGQNAINASSSNFLGNFAGGNATSASHSNFLGNSAGEGATNASNATFIGQNAGRSDGVVAGSQNSNNSIFIGTNSGYTSADWSLNNSTGGTSILIGDDTSTGGHSNSIALGKGATNTATNQFMVGSSSSRIEELVFNGGTGNTCTIAASTGMSCSSDRRLKKNITDLPNTTLESLLSLETVTFNWKEGVNNSKQIGFIAQNLQEHFPELVSENRDGMLAVNYAGITPVIVEAIRELDIKITGIQQELTYQSFISRIINWFGDATNGITEFIAGTIRAKDQLCVGNTCVTESQLQELLSSQNIQPEIQTPQTPVEEPQEDEPADEGDDSTGQTTEDEGENQEQSPVEGSDGSEIENQSPVDEIVDETSPAVEEEEPNEPNEPGETSDPELVEIIEVIEPDEKDASGEISDQELQSDNEEEVPQG